MRERARVLVLLPTTGALNRVLRIEARDDLPASSVYAQHDFRPLAITADYDALTSKAGPLASLAPLVKAGAYRLLLAGSIDAGKSWELPVLLAHLAVALGAELAADPAEADIVLWSTGAVDLDLHIVEHDYKLRAKADHSRATLKQAVAADAQIIALVPTCEDASPLRDMLAEVGAHRACIDGVDGVGAARIILEQALGHSITGTGGKPSPEISAGYFWKIPVVLASLGAIALGTFTVRGEIPWTSVWQGFVIQADTRDPGKLPDHSADTNERKPDDHPLAGNEGKQDDHSSPGNESRTQPADPPAAADDAAQPSHPPADTSTPPRADADHPPAKESSAQPPKEAPHAAALAAPLHLVEMRDPQDRICIPVLLQHLPPRTIDVAMDGPDRFHDSAGRNLCGVEWTLAPEAAQAGIRGFDIDLAAERYGAHMVKTGEPGAWTKVKIEFTRDFSKTINYKVNLKFNGAPPHGQVQQFQHSIK